MFSTNACGTKTLLSTEMEDAISCLNGSKDQFLVVEGGMGTRMWWMETRVQASLVNKLLVDQLRAGAQGYVL